ncbi:MAG: UDP-N-acetylmuramoyl-tripeptide--D-alanyl-D-alanine ligase [Chloroflexi bacterium]|nr:UDP-N-acetylmuramoyl-tripeptide--D-alanyl-D-alanine ligase [Chloroflexota bacterium]
MPDLSLILVALLWAVETASRIYRLARFYQIDEYKSNRFARWWLSKRDRIIPGRSLLIVIGTAALAFIFSEGGAFLPTVIWIAGTLAATYAPPDREVKKKFVATPRARRILAAAWAILFVALSISVFSVSSGVQSSRFSLSLSALLGYCAYLLAPLWLMLGNIAMTPVEAAYRRAYIRRARAIMTRINPTVIGITGSYGKTTTKVFIADLLNARYHAYATPKSFNTMMGITRAINTDLADNYAIDYFIVEMGAYFPGEIKRIAGLTPPHIGVEIEVGPQHLERFKTLERTAAAKYEVIESLPPDGVGIFNWDNPYVRAMSERGYPATRIAVSRTVDPAAAPPDVRFVATSESETLDGLAFTVHDTRTGQSEAFAVPLYGLHNITNLLLAIAVCAHEGMTLRELALRARALRPAESRLVKQTTAQGITILNDAYSANPVGALSALHTLALHTNGRRVLITPGMIELGELHAAENRKLGIAAAGSATDILLVGRDQTAPIAEGVRATPFDPSRLHVFDTLTEAVMWTQSNLAPGDTVLYLNDLPDTY